MDAARQHLKKAVARLEAAVRSAPARPTGQPHGGRDAGNGVHAENQTLRANLDRQQQAYAALQAEHDSLLIATNTVSVRLDAAIDDIRDVLDGRDGSG